MFKNVEVLPHEDLEKGIVLGITGTRNKSCFPCNKIYGLFDGKDCSATCSELLGFLQNVNTNGQTMNILPNLFFHKESTEMKCFT